MGAPSTAISRVDLSMGFNEFSAAMNRKNFIGHLVFPPLKAKEDSGTFRKMTAAGMITPVEDDTRAVKGTYKRDDYEWGTDSYATAEHGVEEVTDDRQIARYGEFNAEAINRDRVVNRVAQSYENACAAAAFDAAYFTGAYTQDLDTASGAFKGDKWSVNATADPIGDMDAARDVVIANCGHAPNALVIEESGLIAILRTARVEDVIKYTGMLDALTARKIVPQLEEVFRVRLIVAQAPIKNTAGRGQTPVFARMWSTAYALLCRIEDGPDLETTEPCLGRTIQWDKEAGPMPGSAGDDSEYVIFEEYREESRRGGVIRGRTDYEIKRLHKPAGFLMSNVL